MASEHWPTYVVLSFYVLATILVTVAANRKNNDPTDDASHVNKHFLGSKDFGPIILTFTTFASVFSGYTVVGVPNESGQVGFYSIRWVGLILVVALSMLWVFPRLRRLSIERSYDSPLSFITDRFRSKLLSILIALCLCLPQVLYIGINLYSLGSVVDGLTDAEFGYYAVTIGSTIMILLFEAFGGMRSVVYTDTVEAIVMIIVFVTIPILIAGLTGGFIGMVNNSDGLRIPCANAIHLHDSTIYEESNWHQHSGCLNYATQGIISEYFLRSPSTVTTINYVLFLLSGMSSALNPHVIQRAMSGKTDRDVRLVIMCIFMAPLLANFPGILEGIAHISTFPELKEEYAHLPAFQAMLAEFRDIGGFAAFFSYVTLVAGIAGIMSTADSALIGVSNTISCDVFKEWITPQYDDNKIVYVGKAVSVTTMCLCLLFSIILWETEANYGVVLTIQQGLLWQAIPAYAFGLYTNLGTNAVLCGTVVGTLTDLILIIIVFAGADPIPLIDKSWSTYVGVLVNVIAALIGHYFIFKGNKSGNNPQSLSLNKIQDIMQGITEPITHYYGALFWLTLCVILSTAFAWIDEPDDEIVEKYGLEEANAFMYNGRVRNVIAGLPDYIFVTLMMSIVAIVMGIISAKQWSVPAKSYQKTVPEMETEDANEIKTHIQDTVHVQQDMSSDDDNETDDDNEAATDNQVNNVEMGRAQLIGTHYQ